MFSAQWDTRRKQHVLEHAKQIGNVRKTCRHFGIPRSLFYIWRGGFQRDGEAGLVQKRRLPRHRTTLRKDKVGEPFDKLRSCVVNT